MTVADKLTYLAETKDHLRTAINTALDAQGRDPVAADAAFRSYAEAIQQTSLFADGRSMSFDFIAQTYGIRSLADPRETVTTADLLKLFPDYSRPGPATYWDANRVLRTAAVDEPRLDHDPVTGEARGVLLEGSATNALTYSEQFDNAVWGVSDVAVASSSDHYVVEKNPIGYARIFQGGWSATNGGNYCAWFVVKAGSLEQTTVFLSGDGGSDIAGRVSFNLSTLATTDHASNGLIDHGIKQVEDGFYLIWVAATLASTTSTRAYLYPGVYNDAQAGSILVKRGQAEEGTKPSSYIKTLDAPVTRAADNLGRALGAEIDPLHCTWIIDIERLADFANFPFLKITDESDSFARGYGITCQSPSVVSAIFRDGESTVATPNTGFATGNAGRIALSVDYLDSGTAKFCVAGGEVMTVDISGVNLPAFAERVNIAGGTRLEGSAVGNVAMSYGTCKAYPYSMTAAQLQEATQ